MASAILKIYCGALTVSMPKKIPHFIFEAGNWSSPIRFDKDLKYQVFLRALPTKKHVAETTTCSIIRSVRDSNSWSHPWQGCVLTKTRPTDQNCGGWIWTNDLRVMSPTSYQAALPRDNKLSDPCGIRTHDTSVKGWCLNHLTNGPFLNISNNFFKIVNSSFTTLLIIPTDL